VNSSTYSQSGWIAIGCPGGDGTGGRLMVEWVG
jgi:hypothetical protein